MSLLEFIILGIILGIISLVQNFLLASYFGSKYSILSEVERDKDVAQAELLLTKKFETWEKRLNDISIKVEVPKEDSGYFTMEDFANEDFIQALIEEEIKYYKEGSAVILYNARPVQVMRALYNIYGTPVKPYVFVSEESRWEYTMTMYYNVFTFTLKGDGFYLNNCILTRTKTKK
jgi:hypothetical protein